MVCGFLFWLLTFVHSSTSVAKHIPIFSGTLQQLVCIQLLSQRFIPNFIYLSCMIRAFFIGATVILLSCKAPHKLALPARQNSAVSGSQLYNQIGALKWKDREPVSIREILNGNVPDFVKRLVAVHTQVTDSATGKIYNATYFVTADYLMAGSNNDFARVPLTPMAAQQIADSLHCFLPTRKMVNDIYAAAKVKMPPVPLFAYRDSAITFYHHHLIIEGQRQNRKGLIAGIKKDVVLSSKIITDAKPNREAIYGWHTLDGKPIQPLYTGHVNWYVDYSHGIRLVCETIIVNGKKYNYKEVLQHPVLKQLLCDEADCSFYRYPLN